MAYCEDDEGNHCNYYDGDDDDKDKDKDKDKDDNDDNNKPWKHKFGKNSNVPDDWEWSNAHMSEQNYAP